MPEKTSELERLRSGIDTLVRVLKITDAAQLPDGGKPLNTSDTQALLYIAANDGCIGIDIARLLGVSATTTSAIVDRLVRRKLINRKRTEANRRVVLLSTTASGRKAAQAILEEQRRHCAQMLEALDPAARTDFVNHVATIAEAIEPK